MRAALGGSVIEEELDALLEDVRSEFGKRRPCPLASEFNLAVGVAGDRDDGRQLLDTMEGRSGKNA